MSQDPQKSDGHDAPAPRRPETRAVTSAGELSRAVRFLDAAERQTGVPLVDEAERERLRRALADMTIPDGAWRVVLAESDGEVVGYGAMVAPEDGGETAFGDVVIAPAGVDRTGVRSALLSMLAELADGRVGDGPAAGVVAQRRLQVWLRHVGDEDLLGVDTDGFRVARRLGILGRRLSAPVSVPSVEEDVTVRSYEPEDAAAVVRLLAAAYAGTEEEGWTEARFREKCTMPWFRAEDLLVAEDDGRLLGLHWLKRREPTVGEVYNLAVHPDGQGRGLGPLLLASGLEHLRAAGMHEVLLWVDRSNERAVRLYTDLGFTTRWDDVALERTPGN